MITNPLPLIANAARKVGSGVMHVVREIGHWLKPQGFREDAALLLVIVEGLLTAAPFLLSWWLCAFYRSIIAGWEVSGMKAPVKRRMLKQMMGEQAPESPNDAG
jgi:hypothetical protein